MNTTSLRPARSASRMLGEFFFSHYLVLLNDFLFLALLRYLLGIIFFLGFLSKSKTKKQLYKRNLRCKADGLWCFFGFTD